MPEVSGYLSISEADLPVHGNDACNNMWIIAGNISYFTFKVYGVYNLFVMNQSDEAEASLYAVYNVAREISRGKITVKTTKIERHKYALWSLSSHESHNCSRMCMAMKNELLGELLMEWDMYGVFQTICHHKTSSISG